MDYSFNPAEISDKIMDALKKERSEMKDMNVMLMGKTGVGKSTLINNLFNERMAETGVGRPVTQDIRKYEKEDFPLKIYDTPGLELGGENAVEQLLNDVNQVIKDGIKSGRIENAIHCILYCVSAASHRFEQEEIDFIKRFLDENAEYNVPVIIVITQSFSKKDSKELKKCIEKENLKIVQVVPVLAEDYELDEDMIVHSSGLDTLSEVIYGVIPEAMKKTFISIQKASIKLKKQKAQGIVIAAASAAAATGAIPIPIADAFALVPEQIMMIASITNVFGMSLEKSTITAIVSGTIGTTGTTIAGKSIVSGLLKLIPGAGSVVGGVISGSVAAALTAALGEAYIAIMVAIAKGELKESDLNSEKGKEFMSTAFKTALSVKRNAKGEKIETNEE